MEIGSIFELEIEKLYDRRVFPEAVFPFARNKQFHTAYFNTGRSAIEAILLHLKSAGKRRIWLPAFCCSSVKDAVLRAGMEICLYPVNRDMKILPETIQDLPLEQTDIFYFVHFFGLLPSQALYQELLKLKKRNIPVFEDVTLSIFSNHQEKVGFGRYIIGSIRKWLALPDGAFLMSDDPLPQFTYASAGNDYTLNYLTAQLMKSRYVEDPQLDKQAFLEYSNDAMGALFDDYTIRAMSNISRNLMRSTDFDQVIERRAENYDILYDLIQDIPGIRPLVKREEGAVPMGMIIAAENRDALFAHLIKNGVYCNIHWRPNDMSQTCEGATYLADHCLTIPCDHRYGKAHMEYIHEQLLSFCEV